MKTKLKQFILGASVLPVFIAIECACVKLGYHITGTLHVSPDLIAIVMIVSVVPGLIAMAIGE